MFGNDSAKNIRPHKGKEFHVRFTTKTIKHGSGNIIVWDYFLWNGVCPIHRTYDTMTRFQYRDILENIILPYASENMDLRWVFQQDLKAVAEAHLKAVSGLVQG